MREIKFRAWDRNSKTFIIPDRLGVWPYQSSLAKEFYIEAEDDDGLPTLPIDFLQFTGLKDKNGTEIYEGDVVSVTLDRPRGVCSVEFEDASFRIRSASGLCAALGVIIPDCIAVIGNIYETPELLK